MASSAQCRSSNTSTVGSCSAMCSRNRRHAVNSSSRSAVGGRLDPEQWEQALAEPGALGALGKHALELGGRDVGCVGLQDPGVGLEDLAERPERDALPVRQASALAPGDERRAGVDVGPSSATIRLLPSPGSPTTVTSWGEVAATVLSKMPLSDREVDLPADERRVVGAGEVGAEARPRGLRVEDPDRLGLALEGRGLQLLVVEDDGGGLVGRRARPRRPSPGRPTGSARRC